MKALTVRQPWASLIADGRKTIEVRSWPTKYRGPLLITASARSNPDNLPTGCTICLVDLIDCRHPETNADAAAAQCDLGEEDWCWLLANPRPVPNLPIKGKLSIWAPPPEILSKLNIEA